MLPYRLRFRSGVYEVVKTILLGGVSDCLRIWEIELNERFPLAATTPYSQTGGTELKYYLPGEDR